MSAVDLETYSLSLLAAKEDVLSGRCSTNWAVFTYGKRNDLKLADSGAGGLEELVAKFADSSLLYALCQVKDPNTGQPRIILINWAGERVDDAYRQTCATHLPAIKAFFKEANVILSARRRDEVTSTAIHNALASLSPSGSTSRKPRLMDSEELVGTNYRKTNPALEMRRTKRDSFWAQAEREEEERKEEERRRLQEERKRWDRERMEQEKKDAEERERKIREKEHLIEEQRKEQARLQAEERKKEKTKWEQQQREHEEEMRDRFRRSESIEKATEAAVLVSQRSLNPREFFRQRENSFSSCSPQSPTSPTAGGARRPALRYQRSLTESSFMIRKPTSPTSPSPSPSYARRHEFFAPPNPRTPPETCSPSMIFSKAGAPTRGGRFPLASPPTVGSQPTKTFLRADSMPASHFTQMGSRGPASPPNIRPLSPTSLPRQEPTPSRPEIPAPASPPRVTSLSPGTLPRDEPVRPPSPPAADCTPPGRQPNDEFRPPASLNTHEPLPPRGPPTAGSPLRSEYPPRPTSPHPAMPPMVDSGFSFASYRAESPSIEIPTTQRSVLDGSTPWTKPAMPESPPRAVSPTLEIPPTVKSVPFFTSDTVEKPSIASLARCEPISENLTPRPEPDMPDSPPKALPPSSGIPSTMESLSLLTWDAVGSPTLAHVTRCEPDFEHITPCPKRELPARPPRAQSPSSVIPSTVESVRFVTSDRMESPSSTILTRCELDPGDVSPHPNPELPDSSPGDLPQSPTTQPLLSCTSNEPESPPLSPPLLARQEPIPSVTTPDAPPALSASPPRSVSPPSVNPTALESVDCFARNSAGSPAVHITHETDPDDIASMAVPAQTGSVPGDPSPVLVRICSETLMSLERTINEEPETHGSTHMEEDLVNVFQHAASERQPEHDATPCQPALPLEKDPMKLPTMSVDSAEMSTVHVSFTEGDLQSELFSSDDPYSNFDTDSISAMLHSLPHYSPLATEHKTLKSSRFEELSTTPVYRPSEDSERDAEALLGHQGTNAPHTYEDFRVNGVRVNGIGGQEEAQYQEVVQEEEEVGAEVTAKACVRAIYDYHLDDARVSLDGAVMIPQLESRNEA
ncbi:drebrin-like isoform X2 [Ambystoma mexicanum]|uniref:drebrin-like isoform X2 n=1 Tax=Ambystoma mexicanum TaxID=8296 RepID=UPI0037E81217